MYSALKVFIVLLVKYVANGGELQTDQCEFMMDRRDFCSHQVAVLFYAFSLRRPKKFIGCPCDNYIRYLKGHCECDYPNSGQPIGDLTRYAAFENILLKIFYKVVK